jgi:carboxyl-terminal processing protease
VKVKVLRRNTPQLLEFRIVRDKIPIYSIDASYMVDDHTGYIRLSRFAATSTDEFRKAENALLTAGMKNLILDLTGNGGYFANSRYHRRVPRKGQTYRFIPKVKINPE